MLQSMGSIRSPDMTEPLNKKAFEFLESLICMLKDKPRHIKNFKS